MAKKDNMVEYRWKIKYPDALKNEVGRWVVGKRADMKYFFQTLCADSELTKDLKRQSTWTREYSITIVISLSIAV